MKAMFLGGFVGLALLAGAGEAHSGQTLLQGWFDLSSSWGGTVQGSNSRYSEGDTIPLRFGASLSAGSQHTVLLKYDFSGSGSQRFFDSLRSYDASVTGADPTVSFSGLGSPVQWSIPVDSSLPQAARSEGFLTGYNISTLSFGAYTLVNGVKAIPVTFTVAGKSGAKNVVIAIGGHLATEAAWGVGNGASSFPGASRKAFASLDGSSDFNVSVNPDALPAASDLAISKVVTPAPIFGGNSLTFVLQVVNNGPDTATSVTVTDPLPAGTTLASAMTSKGTVSGTSTLTFSLGSLAMGASATMTVVVNVAPSRTGQIANTATVSAATFDPVPSNNSASASSTRDASPPAITCPANVVIATAPGQCSAIVNYVVTVSDNSSNPTLVCNPPPGSVFGKGTTPVVCTATDIVGNTSTCSFLVTVVDTEKPVFPSCPADIVVANDPGQCGAVVQFAPPAASDNCPDPVAVVCSPPAGSFFKVGATLVTCTATDGAGNQSTCSFNVTVRDAEGPRITRPDTIAVSTDPGSCDAVVTFPTPAASDNCPGALTVVCNPPSGSVFPIGETTVVCTATDSAGNFSSTSFIVRVEDLPNDSWPNALPLTLLEDGAFRSASFEECLTQDDQSRWFKFSVEPGSKVVAILHGLPANYDLVLFKDIAAAFNELNSQQDLVRVNAEFAFDAFSPAAFSSDAFSPAAFSPAAFSPAAFSPAAFSPAAFSPAAFSPAAFSPAAFSPDMFAPAAFSPAAFSPAAFSPAAFSPAAFSPAAFSPAAFSTAQIQSVIGVSAFDGTANEGIIANTWDNHGDFYLRVRGRNGVFSTDGPFHLEVFMVTGACGNVSPVPVDAQLHPLPPSTVTAPAGGYKTIILTDLGRMTGAGSSQTKADLQNKLNVFAARPEVKGVVVDVGIDSWVSFFNSQADSHTDCPFAKTLVAGAIKDIVDRSRAGNALEYVVVVGNDGVIPFFRYPDEALLGPEKNYVPPVRDFTASQAGLKLNFVLGQDQYGSECALELKSTTIPVPDLAVGRLVETPSEVMGMIDAYLETSGGVVATPTSALVTGYDFLQDSADAVRAQLEAGLGVSADALILDHAQPPTSPLAWTASDLRNVLFNRRHDVIYLAAHFSSTALLASDYSSHLFSSELASSEADLKNALIVSAGCHSGYNVVDADGIPVVTLEPDWAQACARKRATLIAGTGYQYGDTDFIEYSERIYLELSRQLRSGTGPVPVGKALIRAKQKYLATTPQLRGIHQKAFLESAMFGLPMLSLNMPGARLPADADVSIVTSVQPVTANPGLTLGLAVADIAVDPTLTPHLSVLTNPDDGSVVTATYLSGSDGIVNNPAEPILPLEVRNVTVNGTTLRGIGFIGGSYSDSSGVFPLTGAAATEIRGVHASFFSDVFYPVRPWLVNYFDAVCKDSGATTRLMSLPSQFRSTSPGSPTGTLRQFNRMNFRLFYSANTATYTDPANGVPSTPALAAAPAISRVAGTTVGDHVLISARVTGNPAAGIQSVWVTFMARSGSYAGSWQSLDLQQDATDSTLWQGNLPLNGTPSSEIQFMLQAVNGVGLVTLDARLGAFYEPDMVDEGNGAPTSVAFQRPVTSGAYGTLVPLAASLSSGGSGVAGQRVRFSIGDQDVQAVTDSTGLAATSLNLLTVPGSYELKVSFAGGSGFAPSFSSSVFTITRQATALSLSLPAHPIQPGADPQIVATLSDSTGRRLVERTVFFVVSGAGASRSVANITDFNGRAPLGTLALPDGTYSVTAYFASVIPLPPPNAAVDLTDERYEPSTASTPVIIDSQKPVINCPGDIVVSTAPGQCSAVVSYVVNASDNSGSVTVVSTPPSGSTFSKGTNIVSSEATDLAGNRSTCSFKVIVRDTERPVISNCPANIVRNTDPGQCGAAVAFAVPTATDNCPGPVSVVCSPASGSVFPKGTTTVTCTATDASGNVATCSFTVTVNDTEAPSITCPANITVNTDSGTGAARVSFTTTATDNCPGVTVTSTPASGSAFPIGTTTVNCVVTDASGNQSRCSFTITVRDTEPPRIVSLSVDKPTINASPNHKMVLVTVTPATADNGGITTSRIISVSSNEPVDGTGDGDTSPDWIIASDLTVNLRAERAQNGHGRTYTITVRCTDASGNATTGTVTVFVPK